MMADVAEKRRGKGIRLNYPEAVAIISAAALDGARAGKTIEELTGAARLALTADDVMDGVADLIPMVQVERCSPTAAALLRCTHPSSEGSVGERGKLIAMETFRA